MKALKKRFDMTKEEVEKNIRLLPYHRLYLKSMKEIRIIQTRKDMAPPAKLKAIDAIKRKLQTSRRRNG
jgi:hypothetical protein